MRKSWKEIAVGVTRREALTTAVATLGLGLVSGKSAGAGRLVGGQPTFRHSELNANALGSVSSAGVFDSTDKLVRTLWSAKTDDPRTTNPAAGWDGTLDDGTVAPSGTYTVKLLSHNIS